MKHDIPHDLDQNLARKAAQKAVEAYGERFKDYKYTSNWVSEDKVDIGFTVTGRRREGSLTVETTKMIFAREGPFICRGASAKAIGRVEREANKWIEKARNGELDG